MAKTIEIKHVNKGYMLGEEKVPVLWKYIISSYPILY